MNGNNRLVGQGMPPPVTDDDATNQADNSARIGVSDSKSNKGKNHPSFTLILRKQLPFAANAGQALSHQEQDEALDESDTKQTSIEAFPMADMRAAKGMQNFDLAFAWQIWLLDDNGGASGNGEWNVKKHGPPVRTGRQFWSAYKQVHDKFDDVNLKNLMIFQDAIEPKWEDKANLGGGRWYFDVSYNSGRGEISRRDCLVKTNYWTQCLEIVLSGYFGKLGDLVVGLILHFKCLKYRVSLWIRSCSDFNQVIQLGACLRNYLNLRCQLKFELHTSNAAVECN